MKIRMIFLITALLVLNLVLVSCAVAPTTMTTSPTAKPENNGFAAFDNVKNYVNADGQNVRDYLKGDSLIRREIRHEYIIEVFIASADGKRLTHTGTIPISPPGSDEKSEHKEYKTEQGHAVVDYIVNGSLYSRQILDPNTGMATFALYNKDGKILEQITFIDTPAEINETKP